VGIIKNLFKYIVAQDMEKQARIVELVTIIVIFVLAMVVLWLWNFKIDITVPGENGRIVISRMNIFELLFLKK
jgi:hypothetical protein